MTDNNSIKKNVGQALLYISLFILFRTVFVLVMPYYLNMGVMDEPIDTRVMGCHFFDAEYVRLAKTAGYIHKGYHQIYFPLDLVFPVIYTSMFLVAIGIFKDKSFYRYARHIIFAGMAFDYLENFSFAIYLRSGFELSPLVAFFTTIKSIFLLVNFILFLVCIFWGLILLAKARQKSSKG